MATFIKPFGTFLKFLYDITGNYGWALIIFTIAINIVLMPLSFKQQKSMVGMQKIQPKLNEIQKKYQYDKEKQSQEMMKLYKEYNINPMGGCFPMLIQLPIILILYQAVLKPLTYMFGPAYGFTPEVIKALMAEAANLLGKPVTSEVAIFSMVSELGSLWPAGVQPMNFDFLGVALDQTPNYRVLSELWIIPVASALSSYALTMLTNAQSGQQNAASDNSTASSMKMMTNFMPLMTAFIAFSLPAALGFYWTISNVVKMGQQVILNNHFKKIKASDDAPADEKSSSSAPKKKKGRKK